MMRSTSIALTLAGGVVLLGFAPAVRAQTPAPAPPAFPDAKPATTRAPKIQFASKVHDFGRVVSGQIVRADFTFTNAGDAVLNLIDVRPACGCTTAGSWPHRVEPGQGGAIPLQVNTANFNGPVTKLITVTCNDPIQPTVMLQIKGTLWRPVEVTPSFVFFNVVGDTQIAETRTVRITNNAPEPLHLSEPQSSSPAFHASLKTITPDKLYELAISTVPPYGSGTVQGQITAKTSLRNLPLISVTAMATVQPPIAVSPPQLLIPSGPLAKPTSLSVMVHNNVSNAPLKLSAASVSATNIQTQITEYQPGRLFRVLVTLPAGFELTADHPVQLEVKTTSPKMPVITVPIRSWSRPRGLVPTAPPRTLAPVQHPVSGTGTAPSIQ